MTSSFPLLYHFHHIQQNEDLAFWLGLTSERGGAVLELGCGTGRILGPIAQAGHEVYGLDDNLEMLTFLNANLAAELRPHVQIFQADMAAFHLAKQFPMIIMPCNTLSTLSVESRGKSFMLIGQHLAPGGTFAASLPNPLMLGSLPEYSEPEVEETLTHPLSGHPLQISSEWERQGGIFILRWHYDHLLPDGRVERLTGEARHNLSPVEVYLNEMEAAGLRPQAVYGDYDRSPYVQSSSYLIFIMEKFL